MSQPTGLIHSGVLSLHDSSIEASPLTEAGLLGLYAVMFFPLLIRASFVSIITARLPQVAVA